MPPELGFPRYPQVTETTQDGFTRLRSWVRVPQRPLFSPDTKEAERGRGGRKADSREGGRPTKGRPTDRL